ncbi:hypothetical protein PoB_006382200 [Plakobranchus ocellatus]|uniref:Uncharacterized protein n=1 Tax=Plakobranchus ocellatus TaxID=259542 RepID=A0AAV4CZJ3_9GAST|nr:hypothetical protein PoB_006382200 [Plakobranchus ocellatus]
MLSTAAEPTAEPNQGVALCGTPALYQGYPGAIFLAEGEGPLLGLTKAHLKKSDQPIGQHGSVLPSRVERREWPRGPLMNYSH